MKLIRKGQPGEESPGLILTTDGREVDVFLLGKIMTRCSLKPMVWNAFRSGCGENESDLPTSRKDERYGAPIARPSKIVCIGLNFDDHAAESGMDIPEEPVFSSKQAVPSVGPNDDLVLPRGGDKTDWEVELAFVIGKRASYVEEKDAMDHLAGYALHNDYSERAFQLKEADNG